MPGPAKSFAGKGVYPASEAGWLVHPLRRIVMSPRRMVGRLALKPHELVLEIGPGPGWFSPSIARGVPEGRLVMLDVQPEMLAMAGKRLKAAQIGNFDAIVADAVRLPLRDAAFDAAFIVTVLGEMSDPLAGIMEVARVVRPGGRILIAEQLGDPDHIKKPALLGLANQAGLKVRRSEGSSLLYSVLAER